MAQFGPVLTAMVTPFDDSGALDLDRAQGLARHLVANGNDGVVVAGTTGEAPTLTTDEQVELFAAVREALPNHAVIAGTGSNDTRSAIANTQGATAAGVDGVLVVTPYYNRPSQAGLEAHFTAVAAATDKPVVLYDIPIRTGRKIETDTLLRLAEIDNIVAVKDAAGDPAETASLLAKVDGALEVYSGDDSLTLPFLSVGGVGVIGVATHWIGQMMSDMITAYSKGQVAEAIALNAAMIPSFDYEAMPDAPNPVPSKAMMNLLGVPVGQCRPPMGPEPDDLADRARAVLAGLGRSVA
ncbi:MAG: 4-hydroxy-tetrahydrodipicolinate synthase [Acidimicrobiia bacterium]|nr:4-hydroxy-tetrahydrodipicolinate synthase [Acidimicrobiia bacterium]